MTNDTIIKVEGLSKKYRRYGSVAEGLKEVLHPFRKKYHKEFWALRDVSFELKRGESLGIVGRNGSGKSTLLQILCGVMQPTGGSVQVGGKIAALLELGAGFHPEFSGRENIFLQGALMGLTKEDIEERFDDIAAFADIGDFMEEPVRTYSSGMYVRLAFSAAINVDPDILMVDEALSVGDMRFRQKCYRRIDEFRDKGKSIILITHDMSAVQDFCTKAAWLKDGVIAEIGNPADVVKSYSSYMHYDELSSKPEKQVLEEDKSGVEMEWSETGKCSSFGEGGAEIKRVALYAKEPYRSIKISSGADWVIFSADITASMDVPSPIVGLTMQNEHGQAILGIGNWMVGADIGSLTAGQSIIVEFELKLPLLKNGAYSFSVSIADGTESMHSQLHWVHDAYLLDIFNSNPQCNMFYFGLSKEDVSVVVKA